MFRNGRPAKPPGKAVPLLTVQNATTGEWTTRAARPTGAPGIYRTRVVFRQAGQYKYAVLFGDEFDSVAVPPTKPAPPVNAADDSLRRPIGLVLLVIASTLPIVLRRRYPIAVLAVTLAAALAADLAYDNFLFAGPLVALYTVAAHVGRPRSLQAAGATAVALALLVLGVSNLGSWEALSAFTAFGAAWLLGDNLRTRRERAARLEAERQANVKRATAEEQARIGREVHDIVGHSVSVMTIQASAALDAFDQRPAQVREALRAIETTGRETLAELRRLLGGVRPDDDAFAPVPGLAGLDALAERVLGTIAPSTGLVLETAAWLALICAVSFALALGVSSVFDSAGGSIATLLALWLVVTPLVQNLESLDWLSDALMISGFDRLMPDGLMARPENLLPSLAGAIALLVAWAAVPLLAGAWRTMTRDA